MFYIARKRWGLMQYVSHCSYYHNIVLMTYHDGSVNLIKKYITTTIIRKQEVIYIVVYLVAMNKFDGIFYFLLF